MTMPDRPARPARGKLQPPTTTVDPIDAPQPPAAQPAAAPAAAAPSASTPVAVDESRVSVQSGIRWSLATERLVREAKARTGKTRIAIVEEAIAQVWGPQR